MNNIKRQLREEKGTTVLMAAAIMLPLMFFLFSLSLDATRYMAENQQSQKVLDEVAAYAYRFLPFENETKQAVQSYLLHYPRLAPNTAVTVDADTVSLLYSGLSPLTFPQFFGFSAGLPITAYSRARGAPFDTMILLDASAYLAPDILSASAWGDPLGWPAGSFFANEFQLSAGGSPIDARTVTQQCFNPAFSGLKRAAITTFEYLSHFQFNAVGLGIYPGNNGDVDILRDVVSSQAHPIGPGETGFDTYIGPHNRNELCAAAAEREQLHPQYKFSPPNLRLESGLIPPDQPVNFTLFDASQSTWRINPEFIPYVRARDVLWSQTVRENTATDSAEVLREVRARLIGAEFQGERGGLSNSVLKTAFIFAGDVPRLGGLRFPAAAVTQALTTQIDSFKSDIAASQQTLYLKLFYVLFRHQGNDYDNFVPRIGELADFFNSQQKINGADTRNLEITLVYTDSAEVLMRSALGALIMSRRTAILSR